MNINMDFTKPVVVRSNIEPWVNTPLPGVTRRLLEREGGGSATRATSIVNYQPNSSFSEHCHTGGEEYFVLDGIFSDETGNFSKGTYVRNPPGSRHAPFSKQGCRIFVKLEQFDPQDTQFLHIDTENSTWQPNTETGMNEVPLYSDNRETVKLVAIPNGATVNQAPFPGGCELLLLNGTVTLNQKKLDQHTWIRMPADERFSITGQRSARLYVKYGHLLA